MNILGDGHGRSLNSLEELWEHKWFGAEVGPIIDGHQQHGDSSQSRDTQNQLSNRVSTQEPPDKPQVRPRPNRPPRHQSTSASQPYRPDTHTDLLREPVGPQHLESSTWKDRQKVFIKPLSNKLPQTKNNNNNINASQQNGHLTPPPPPRLNSKEAPVVASSTAPFPPPPPLPPIAQANSASSSSFSPGSFTIPQRLENNIITDNNNDDGGDGHELEYDEDDDINAAWRWRFTRRWQAEQVRHMHAAAQPDDNEDDDDVDDWTVAENLLKHSNGLEGLQLQLGRTLSTLEGQMSMDPRSPGLSILLEESFSMKDQASPFKDEVESERGGGGSSISPHNHPHQYHQQNNTSTTTTTTGNENGHHRNGMSSHHSTTNNKTPEATSAIVAVAKRVEHLLREQAKIEQTVVERLDAAQINSAWVGATLPVVQVDTWGRFAFILASVADKDHHKLLVRGLNGQDEQQTISKLKLEASRAAAATGTGRSSLPPVAVHIIGAGMIEWGSSSNNKTHERRVFINRTQVRAILGKDARVKTDGDVMHVTIDLLNRNLAKNISVMVGSNPLRR